MAMKVRSASEDGLLRLITDFRFADGIIKNAKHEEADVLDGRLDTTTTRLKMEIGPDKTKVSDEKQSKWLLKRDKDKRHEVGSSFKYLGSIDPNIMEDLNHRFIQGLLLCVCGGGGGGRG